MTLDQATPAEPGVLREDPLATRRRAWGLTGVLVLMYVVNYADKAVLGIIAQPLAQELKLDSSQIGLVGSAFFLMMSIGGLLSGVLHRHVGMRWALVLLVALWSIAMLPLVVVATFGVLLASRMLLGLAEGPNSALLHTAVYTWHPPERRGLPGALLGSASAVAKIAIAPLLTYVAVTWGWRATLVVLAVAGLLWAILWLTTWKEGPYLSTRVSAEATTEAETVPWHRIFMSATFIGGVLVVMVAYALLSVVLTWLPSYFEVGLGYSRLQSGSMFAIPSVIGLVVVLIATTCSDRIVTRGATTRVARVILPTTGLLVGGVVLATLPYIETPWLAVVIVSAGYAVGTAVFPLFNVAISEVCPPRQLAGTLGVFLSLMAVGGFVAPYLTGRIVDAAADPGTGYATSFQMFGVAAIVVAVLAMAIIDPQRDRARIMSSNRT